MAPDIIAQWGLDPGIAFLNHGSFGARPRKVLEAQSRRRAEFEASPIDWLQRRRSAMIEKAKQVVGGLIGATPSNFGFVANATSGINAVLRSLRLGPGDELLTTSHVYNGVRQAMRHASQRAAATYVEARIPLPLGSSQPITRAVESAFTARTRLLVIDHIASPTAVVFPVEEILAFCESRGVDVLIDGAHTAGMLPLDIEKLNAAYYAGNLHKWVCAPPGAAFLWVRPDRQADIHPPTVSHFLDQGLASEFDWQGTRDITPWLCVPDAMEYLGAFGWDRVMRHNHQMAVWVQSLLSHTWEVEPTTPLDGSMLGSMVTVKLPAQDRLRRRYEDPEALGLSLYRSHRIEAPIIDWDGQWWVRPCCQIYNTAEQFERLGAAVKELIA